MASRPAVTIQGSIHSRPPSWSPDSQWTWASAWAAVPGAWLGVERAKGQISSLVDLAALLASEGEQALEPPVLGEARCDPIQLAPRVLRDVVGAGEGDRGHGDADGEHVARLGVDVFDQERGVALDPPPHGLGEPPLSIGAPPASQPLCLVEMVPQVDLSIELVSEHGQCGVSEREGGVQLHGALERLLRSGLHPEESAERLVEEVGRRAGRRQGQSVEVSWPRGSERTSVVERR